MFYSLLVLCVLFLAVSANAMVSKDRWASEFRSRLSSFEDEAAFQEAHRQAGRLLTETARRLEAESGDGLMSFAVFFAEPGSEEVNDMRTNLEAQKRHEALREATKQVSGHYQHISKTSGVASLTPDMVRAVEKLDFVESVAPFVGDLKVERSASCSGASEDAPVSFNFMTVPMEGRGLDRVLGRLSEGGLSGVEGEKKRLRAEHEAERQARVQRRFGRVNGLTTVEMCEDALKKITSDTAVAWVEQHVPNRVLNKWGTYSSQGGGYDYYTPIWDAGLTGSGQVIGISDTGLDVNHGFFYDSSTAVPYDTTSASHRKLTTYITFVDNADAEAGHGTHVCGSAMGNTQAGDSFKGSAYDAKVAFMDIGDSSESLSTPTNVDSGIYTELYTANARIMSSSWGAATNTYTFDAYNSDNFMYSNPDALVLYAAGNDGSDGEGSVASPSVGKNVVSVGASLNDFQSWKSATGTTARSKYNVDSVAYFSGQGPTAGGLLKPDVLGQGYYLKSAMASSGSASGHTSMTLKAGTSMATPLTAGNAALLRQYFMDGYYPTGKAVGGNAFTPSGALLKAALVHSGQQMDALLSASGQKTNIDYPGYQQGYGRVQMDKVLDLDNSYSMLAWGSTDTGNTISFSTVGESVTMVFNMTSDLEFLRDFKVTMAYTDEPVGFSDPSLSNDVDLLVTYEGTDYYPSWSGTGPDTVNTVEQVVISSPAANSTVVVTVTLTTKGSTGTQEIGLVVSGAFEGYSYNSSSVLSADDDDLSDEFSTVIGFFEELMSDKQVSTYGAIGLAIVAACIIYKCCKKKDSPPTDEAYDRQYSQQRRGSDSRRNSGRDSRRSSGRDSGSLDDFENPSNVLELARRRHRERAEYNDEVSDYDRHMHAGSRRSSPPPQRQSETFLTLTTDGVPVVVDPVSGTARVVSLPPGLDLTPRMDNGGRRL